MDLYFAERSSSSAIKRKKRDLREKNKGWTKKRMVSRIPPKIHTQFKKNKELVVLCIKKKQNKKSERIIVQKQSQLIADAEIND